MLTTRPVVVMQMPEKLDVAQVQTLLRELEPMIECHRPRIVLDCSQIAYLDSAGVEMLMHCLEEAMKRDGDLKLAAVSPQSEMILELMRVDRVFEVFETSEEAVRSFSVTPVESPAQEAPRYPSMFEDWEAVRQAS